LVSGGLRLWKVCMKVKILVVDDDELVLGELQKLFQKNGFESKIASDGFNALDLIRREHFDIVYTDMKMPRLDGADVCKMIKEFSPDTLVVLVSGSPHAIADRQIAFLKNGGIDKFLRKPLSAQEIITATKELIDQKKQKQQLF